MMSHEDSMLPGQAQASSVPNSNSNNGQQPVYIVIQSNRSANDRAHFEKTMPRKLMIGIGGAQITMAGNGNKCTWFDMLKKCFTFSAPGPL